MSNGITTTFPIVRYGACILIFVCLGCATLHRDRLSRISPDTEIDARSLAKSQATLAVESAEVAEQQGKIDDAIRLYEQARTLDPQWNHLSRRLAVLYDQRGNDTRARAAYEQAFALCPNDPELLNDFGVFHLHREQWSAAEVWFRRALAAHSDHERATVNLAMSLAMQGRLNESYEAFSRIVGPAAAYSNLGVLLTRQGRIDEAREHFRRALVIDRTIHPAGEFLAHLLSPS